MKREPIGLIFAAAIALIASPSLAAPPEAPGPRSEVPIREVDLTDGTRRYVVTIRVGGAPVDAVLVTGASGLLVLSSQPGLAAATQKDEGGGYNLGTGEQVRGHIVQVEVGIGEISRSIKVQTVETLTCIAGRKDCTADKIPFSKYGFDGDGLPNQGFAALLGTNMGDGDIPTPLKALGVKRWIVDLPLPGEKKPGRLVLNPGDDELKDYSRAAILPSYTNDAGGRHDAVNACLVNNKTNFKVCGSTAFDTGTNGWLLSGKNVNRQDWADGVPAILAIYRGSHLAAIEGFQTGDPSHDGAIRFRPFTWINDVAIQSGLTGYFAFSILYDPAARQLGFRQRDYVPHGIQVSVKMQDTGR